MGWLFTHLNQAQLVASLVQPRSSASTSVEVLEHHLADRVLWSFTKVTSKEDGWNQLKAGESLVFIRCDLLESSGDGWGYKPLEESMHPYYFSCPLHFLELAPEQCPEWRAAVRQFHDNAANASAAQSLAVPRDG